MIQVVRMAFLLSLSTGICACSIDPYERPFVWHPTGANEANLAAMLVNPTDLARGRGMGPADGLRSAAAIDRLYSDRVKPLAGTSGAAAGAGTAPTSN